MAKEGMTFHHTADVVRAAVAPAAVASPLWLPMLQTVSQGAALVLPILGVIWIVIQVTDHFNKKRK